MVILTILILPIQEHSLSFHLIDSSSISFMSVIHFLEHRSFASLGRFIPRYFILSDVMVNGTVSLISLCDISLSVYRNATDFFFFFNWRIVALQCCGGLCCTSMWVSYNHICMYYIPIASPHPSPFHPSGSSQSARLHSVLYSSSHWWFALHVIVHVCQSNVISLSYPLLPTLCPPVHSLHLHLHFFSVNRFIRTINIFLDPIHMH